MDDDASVVDSYGGFRVEPFGGDPGDEELLRALEAVSRRHFERRLGRQSCARPSIFSRIS